MAELPPIEGYVASVRFSAGRADWVFVVLAGPDGRDDPYALSLTDPETRITVGGATFEPSRLLWWLATADRPVMVVLHPRAERYGLSTEAEFRMVGA